MNYMEQAPDLRKIGGLLMLCWSEGLKIYRDFFRAWDLRFIFFSSSNAQM